MYVTRILYPVEVLGPGKRVGIWFCGCPRRCKGCSNSELWEFQDRYRTTPQKVFELVKQIVSADKIDGFTITGGEPLLQPNDLNELIELLRSISNDILVYTGYVIENLPCENLQGIAVLIDGEYIEERNTGCFLRGSDNQRIHILDSTLKEKYEAYIKNNENMVQNFTTSDGIISVGIHRPNFLNDLDIEVSKKGVRHDV